MHVHEKEMAARTMLSCIQDETSRTENSTNTPCGGNDHEDVRNPPPLTKFPSGYLDATHRREIELWIEENGKKKNSFVAAVDQVGRASG